MEFNKTDKQLQQDLDKVFKKKKNDEVKKLFAKDNLDYLYLYITDSFQCTPAVTAYDNVHVIVREYQESFYGTLRTSIFYLYIY